MSEDLTRERDQLWALLEHTEAQLAYLDTGFNFVLVNEAYVRGCGHSRQELIGRNHFALFPNAENQAIFERARDTGEPVSFRAKPFVYRDQPERGTTYWDWTLTPIKDAAGRVQGLAFSLTDVTARERFERQQESLQRYAREQALLFTVSSVLTTSLDPERLLSQLLGVLLDHLGCDAGWVMVSDAPPAEAPRLVAWQGVPETFARAALQVQGAPLRTRNGQPVGDAIPPLAPELLAEAGLQAYATVPLTVGERLLGVLCLGHRGAAVCPALDGRLALSIGQQAGMALYNAQLYQAARQVDRLRVLNELDRALAATLDPLELLQLALRHVAMALGSALGALLPLEPGRKAAEALAFWGQGWPRLKPWEEVVEQLTAVLAGRADPREPIAFSAADLEALCMPGQQQEIARWGAEGLLIPIRSETGLVATLLLGARANGHPFSAEDYALAQAAASRTGQAIRNALLFADARQQHEQLRALAARLAEVEEAERQRVARELHDTVGQNLTALGLNLNIAQMHLPPGAADAARSRLKDSLDLVQQTTEFIRGVMADLRPPVLDDYGLVAALRWYGAQFASRTGVEFSLRGQELSPRLPALVETALFRIAQEALTNVARHAQAMHVTVSLEASESLVRLTIADDGVGFDPEMIKVRATGRGWGLLSMTERAEAAGGRARVESRAYGGTRVLVEVPR